MDKKLSLLRKIEMCRVKMIKLSHTHQLTSAPVLSASMELDDLLNELDKIKDDKVIS